MLAHTVIFWLKNDLSEDQRNAFREGLESLKGIEYSKGLYIGTPAATSDRPIIDKSYHFGITAVFDSMKNHDAYQIHPLHKAFLEKFVPLCEKIQVYDFD